MPGLKSDQGADGGGNLVPLDASNESPPVSCIGGQACPSWPPKTGRVFSSRQAVNGVGITRRILHRLPRLYDLIH